MPLKLNSSGGGSITLQEPSTASNRTLTLPDNTGNLISSADSGTVSQAMLAAGVAGTGPAFSAYQSNAQTLSSATSTKINFQTELWDTANCFDPSLSRFTPNVAGHYQVNGGVAVGATSTPVQVYIHKNGANYKAGMFSGGNVNGGTVSGTVYLNGSTDYVELYAYFGTGQICNAQAPFTWFDATLVRAA